MTLLSDTTSCCGLCRFWSSAALAHERWRRKRSCRPKCEWPNKEKSTSTNKSLCINFIFTEEQGICWQFFSKEMLVLFLARQCSLRRTWKFRIEFVQNFKPSSLLFLKRSTLVSLFRYHSIFYHWLCHKYISVSETLSQREALGAAIMAKLCLTTPNFPH